MVPSRWLPVSCVFVLALVLFGCEEKTERGPTTSVPDAGAKGAAATVDPNLAKAVAQAAQTDTPSSGASGPAKGPPETGVFAPGEADKEIPPGTPASLKVGSSGSGKKVTLRSAPPSPDREGRIEVSVRTGPRSVLPTIDFEVAFEASKAKADDSGDEEGEKNKGSATSVVGRVISAKLAENQPGRIPPEVEAEIKKFKGSRVLYEVSENGWGHDFVAQPAKALEGGLARVVRGLGEVLAVTHLPMPGEPVGPGAYWMIASRENYAGADVLAYRLVRLESIEGHRVTLSVDTKRYVAGGRLDFPGLVPHQIEEQKGSGKAELVVSAQTGQVLAGQINQAMIASLAPDNEPGKRLSLQFEINAKASFTGR